MSYVPNTDSAFEGADRLWESMQNNLTNYINDEQNGGSAAIDSTSTERVNWQDVKDILNGVKPISELGCK